MNITSTNPYSNVTGSLTIFTATDTGAPIKLTLAVKGHPVWENHTKVYIPVIYDQRLQLNLLNHLEFNKQLISIKLQEEGVTTMTTRGLIEYIERDADCQSLEITFVSTGEL